MTLLEKPGIPLTWVIRGKSKLSAEQIEFAEQVLGVSFNNKYEAYVHNTEIT